MRGLAQGAAVVGALLLQGCMSSAFTCGDDSECSDGYCESSSYCSFDDDACESGRRYGSYAGSGLSNTCVPAQNAATGSTTAPGSTTTSPEGTSSATGAATSSSEDSAATTSGIAPGTGLDESTTSTSTGAGVSTSTGDGSSSSNSGGSTRVLDGLVVFFALDEGEGTTVHDSAPQGPPIDLLLEGEAYAWTDDGLRFTGSDGTMAASTTSTDKVVEACLDSESLTLEAWVTPHAIGASGPPRVVTFSQTSALRNFSLLLGRDNDGKQEPAVRGRVRVSDQSSNALNGTPSLMGLTPKNVDDTSLHAVFVHDELGAERIYLDGTLIATGLRSGTFATWETVESRIALGNELTGTRPIDATIHLVAIYCRALNPDEVIQNFDAGY